MGGRGERHFIAPGPGPQGPSLLGSLRQLSGKSQCGLLKAFHISEAWDMRTPSRGGEGLSTLSDLWPVVSCRPHGAAPADFSAGRWLVGRHVWVPASAGAATAMSKQAFHCCLTGGLILAFSHPLPVLPESPGASESHREAQTILWRGGSASPSGGPCQGHWQGHLASRTERGAGLSEQAAFIFGSLPSPSGSPLAYHFLLPERGDK